MDDAEDQLPPLAYGNYASVSAVIDQGIGHLYSLTTRCVGEPGLADELAASACWHELTTGWR